MRTIVVLLAGAILTIGYLTYTADHHTGHQHEHSSMSPEDFRTKKDAYTGGGYQDFHLKETEHAGEYYDVKGREYDAEPKNLYYEVDLTKEPSQHSFQHIVGDIITQDPAPYKVLYIYGYEDDEMEFVTHVSPDGFYEVVETEGEDFAEGKVDVAP